MLIKQKMENVDLHERRDNKHPLHVVTCFQFLRKKENKKKKNLHCALQIILIVSFFSPPFRYLEFKMCESINTGTVTRSGSNNSEISRQQHGWNRE